MPRLLCFQMSSIARFAAVVGMATVAATSFHIAKVRAADIISIAGTTSGATLHTLAVATADLFTKELPELTAVPETGGSVSNMRLLQQDAIDMSVAGMPVPTFAALGVGPFEGPVDIKLGWIHGITTIHLIANDDSGIETIADLKGKRLAYGAAGSGVAAIFDPILRAHGLDPATDIQKAYLGPGEAIEALQNGQIEAAFAFSGVPGGRIQAAAAQNGIKFVRMNVEKTLETATSENVHLVATTIPNGTYEGVDEDVETVGVAIVTVINRNMDPALVQKMAALIEQNVDRLVQATPAAEGTRIATEKDAAEMRIPLHPGIAAYWEAKK